MRKICYLLLLTVIVATGCKKDPVMYSKGIESFALVEKNASGQVVKEYPGTITGEEIIVSLPIEVDVTKLVVNFKAENARTIVQVGGVVQEPGITEQDFSTPVALKIKAEDKSTRTYQVRVEKKVALESFGFFAADNPGLEDDYKAVIRGTTIDIAVPESLDLSKLVARFTTTAGAKLKIGQATQQSQVTVNNFSTPVVYIFEDPTLSVAQLTFTTAVSFIGPKWWMIGDKNIIVPSTSELKMAIDPISKYPYLAYVRSGKDEAGATIPTEGRKVAVIGFDGAGWTSIGPSTGISDGRAADLFFSFSSEGIPHVGYRDYLDEQQKGTVLQYRTNTWSAVGTKNFTPMKIEKFSFTVAENNEPIVAATAGNLVPGYTRRTLYAYNYNSGWKENSPILKNQLAVSLNTFTGLDGNAYLAVGDRDNNLSMFKRINGEWKPVGPLAFRGPDNFPIYVTVIGAASATGEVYIGYQTRPATDRINHILKYNPATSVWEELGSAGNSQGTEMFNLAIGPKGELYFAFVDNAGLNFRTFNKATNNWNNTRLVVSGKITAFDMQVSTDGIPYIAVSTTADGRTAVYKYTPTK